MPEEITSLEGATIRQVLEAYILLEYLEQTHIDTSSVSGPMTIEDLLIVHGMVDEAEWKQLVVDAADKMGVDLPNG